MWNFFTKLSGNDPCEKCINILIHFIWFIAKKKSEKMYISWKQNYDFIKREPIVFPEFLQLFWNIFRMIAIRSRRLRNSKSHSKKSKNPRLKTNSFWGLYKKFLYLFYRSRRRQKTLLQVDNILFIVYRSKSLCSFS